MIKQLLTNTKKACRYPTKMKETEDHSDASHGAVATYRPSEATSNGRIRGEAVHILWI
jgi:hypothetical protein